MNVVQKEIVLLPYPFSDLESLKIRPALVVSNDIFNNNSNDCVMVPLTSVIKDELYSIVISKEDLSAGRLIKTSRIKVDKIFAVQKSLIKMKIGRLNNKSFDKVRKELLRLF